MRCAFSRRARIGHLLHPVDIGQCRLDFGELGGRRFGEFHVVFGGDKIPGGDEFPRLRDLLPRLPHPARRGWPCARLDDALLILRLGRVPRIAAQPFAARAST